jgi:aspartyl protease family protein
MVDIAAIRGLDIMRNIVIFIAVALLLASVTTQFADKFATQPTKSADRAVTKPATTGARATTPDVMYVAADRQGHFSVNAIIGGRSVAFVVDTGATIVALTRRDADRLGINLDPRDFTMGIQTANGVTRGAKVRLAAITVGPLTVQDVNAIVLPAGSLLENLLGMTFLSRLRRYEFRTGQLVMEQ